mmetsp:Transcript_76927/g.170393  ORF Transcript_76927/g.170393 Transcript_76927/m.170393 type:complete len:396 (+) Transcript_76927:872-2059(+)
MLDVGLLLLSKERNHRVDGSDDLVEVTGGLHLSSKLHEVQGPVAPGQSAQLREGLVTAAPGDSVAAGAGCQLQEGRRGILEDLRRLGAREELDGTAHACKLLGAELHALRPLTRLHLAGVLRVREELLVSLELRFRVVEEKLAIRELLRLRRFVIVLLLERHLQSIELLLLRGHQLLERLLRVRLLSVRLFQVRGESVVHAPEDALDLRGLRGVIPEGVLGDLHRAQAARTPADEGVGPLDEVLHHLNLLVREGPRDEALVQDPAQAGSDAQHLRLLEGLEEALLAGACTRENLDGGLQGTDALLRLGLLLLEVHVPLLADFGRLALRLHVPGNVSLELPDLRAVRGDLGLQLLDQRLQILDLLLSSADVICFAPECVLTPARILVVRLSLQFAI